MRQLRNRTVSPPPEDFPVTPVVIERHQFDPNLPEFNLSHDNVEKILLCMDTKSLLELRKISKFWNEAGCRLLSKRKDFKIEASQSLPNLNLQELVKSTINPKLFSSWNVAIPNIADHIKIFIESGTLIQKLYLYPLNFQGDPGLNVSFSESRIFLETVKRILKNCPNLILFHWDIGLADAFEHLAVDYDSPYFEPSATFNLQTLELGGFITTMYPNFCLELIKACPRLRKLEFQSLPEVYPEETDDLLLRIAQFFENLVKIPSITKNLVEFGWKCKRVDTIIRNSSNLRYYPLGGHHIGIPPELLQILVKLELSPQLKRLRIGSSSISKSKTQKVPLLLQILSKYSNSLEELVIDGYLTNKKEENESSEDDDDDEEVSEESETEEDKHAENDLGTDFPKLFPLWEFPLTMEKLKSLTIKSRKAYTINVFALIRKCPELEELVLVDTVDKPCHIREVCFFRSQRSFKNHPHKKLQTLIAKTPIRKSQINTLKSIVDSFPNLQKLELVFMNDDTERMRGLYPSKRYFTLPQAFHIVDSGLKDLKDFHVRVAMDKYDVGEDNEFIQTMTRVNESFTKLERLTIEEEVKIVKNNITILIPILIQGLMKLQDFPCKIFLKLLHIPESRAKSLINLCHKNRINLVSVFYGDNFSRGIHRL